MYEEKGAQVIAMAVQPQEEAALSVERSEAQFPILADREHAVADAYGVYNHFSDSEAAASVFIISKDGGIIWESIAAYQTQRVPSQTILENLPGAEEAKTEEIVADFTLPDSNGNMVSLANLLRENEQVVLVFYYTYLCNPCMSQLEAIENDRAKYEEKGAQVIAIAVQSGRQAETSANTSGAQFPILADSDHAFAEAYGVYDLLPEDDGLSTPSVFIINQDRQIVWKHIASSIFEEGEEPSYPSCGGERVPSQTILENLPGA